MYRADQSLFTIPNDLFCAIEHALMILGWFEFTPQEDLPPEWMWSLPDELNSHFKRVNAEKRRKSGGGGDSRVSDAYNNADEPEGESVINDLWEEWRK